MRLRFVGAFASVAVLSTASLAQSPKNGVAGIQWFSTLRAGLDEAKRTGRPILFMSAAPHCAGVSGVW